MNVHEVPAPSSKIVLERHVGNMVFRGEIHYDEDYRDKGLRWYIVGTNGQVVARGEYATAFSNVEPRHFIMDLDNRIAIVMNDVAAGTLPSFGFMVETE